MTAQNAGNGQSKPRRKRTQADVGQPELMPAQTTAKAEPQPERMPATIRHTPENDGTPASLLRIAVESGADVEKLERLMALQERWEKGQAEKAYFAAMNEVQRELVPIVKDRHNPQTKSRYATLEAVHRAITPVYTAHGFSISFSEGKAEKDGYIRILADVMHCNGHSRQYSLELALDTKGIQGSVNKTEVHGKGSTISYGRRYLEMQIWNLTVTDEDTDGVTEEPVTQQQYADLKELIDESGANEAKFCEAFGAASLSAFPSSRYEEGLAGLKKKLAQKLGRSA